MSSCQKIKKGNHMNTSLTKLAGLAAGLMVATSVGAVEFSMGGADVTVSNKLSVGAAWRLKDPDPVLIGYGNGGTANSTNGDDGNLAWEKGDMVASTVKFTSDVSLTMGDFGLFVRGSGIYNSAVEGQDLFDPADYQTGTCGAPPCKEQPASEIAFKEDLIRDHVGTDFDLLDAYIFGRFTVMDRALLIKVGRQVLNWGESVFVQHGLNALITADVNQLRVPGWEIEEVQTPVGMAVISLDLFENVGIEAFYQYEWQKTIIDAPARSGAPMTSPASAGRRPISVSAASARTRTTRRSAAGVAAPRLAWPPAAPFRAVRRSSRMTPGSSAPS